MRICAYEDCGKRFNPASHNQKYHSPECCRLATNKRIMEQYYANKEKRILNKPRYCKKCKVQLSRYNESKYCNSCDPSDGINGGDLLELLGFGTESWRGI